MSHITGSQAAREEEIQNRWLVFQPTDLVNFNLYSAPLGQRVKPEVLLDGLPELHIHKEVHIFDSEQTALRFIEETGEQNIALVKETNIDRPRIEVHVITPEIAEYSLEITNFDERNGYRIEVFRSSSAGLSPSIRRDASTLSASTESYLNFFDLETDNG